MHYEVVFLHTGAIWPHLVCKYALLNNRAEKPAINIKHLRGAEACSPDSLN
jgi:hypothetical protein